MSEQGSAALATNSDREFFGGETVFQVIVPHAVELAAHFLLPVEKDGFQHVQPKRIGTMRRGEFIEPLQSDAGILVGPEAFLKRRQRLGLSSNALPKE